ncbi:MAG TPA: RHS repeat-associated core domain-containing protein [Solirubrobacteraceae bacterium]|nr:RHS repeat-associated core domain-containing protein [Solirubrobacteraceae bacterium]
MAQAKSWRRQDGQSRDHTSSGSCLLHSRLLLFCVVLVVFAVALPAAVASARTLSVEPSGGGFVENPDHTWTLYAYGHVIKVYSAAEKETIDRVWHGEEFDLIPGRASGKEVTGISSGEAEAAAGLVNRLRTGKPYATTGEREVGEGYMRTVEEKGIIEKRAEAVFGGLYEKTLESNEPFAVAISNGYTVERMFTLPEWTDTDVGGEKEHGERGGLPIKYFWSWYPQFKIIGHLQSCSSISVAGGGGVCAYAAQPVDLTEEWWEPIEKKWVSRESLDKGGYESFEHFLPLACVVDSPYPTCGNWASLEESGGEEIADYVNATALEGSVGEIGFPAEGIGSYVPEGDHKLNGETSFETEYNFNTHDGATSVSNADVAPLADELEIAYALQSSLLPGLEGGVVPSPMVPGEPPLEGHQNRSECDDPVDCATGDETLSQTDLRVGGRGVGLDLTRSYNSQAAAAGVTGLFGYGWTSSFSDHLVLEPALHLMLLVMASGETVPFSESGGSFTAPASSQDKLAGSSEAGYTLTLPDQTKMKFQGSSGRLESVTDRNGNETKLAYNGTTHLLETITDPAGRKLTLKENAEGFVESAKDPMGHEVKYTYKDETLATVTLPGESSPNWTFETGSSHLITEIKDGRAGKTTNKYNANNQVHEQTDPLGHTLKFAYATLKTTITNEATGAVTSEQYAPNGEPASITRGYGTGLATAESWEYNSAGYETAFTDGNGHTTKYGYDGSDNLTSMIDPDSDETKWEYDSTHDVISMTIPKGETTTIKRNSDGDAETVERPAPGEKTQSTKYAYGSHGEVESMTDPLGHVWKYEYDTYGDRTGEIDPESDKRTWEYNEDSQEIATVSPRGNVSGAEPGAFATTVERDQQGRPVSVTEPSREPVYNSAFGSSGSGNGQFQFPTLGAVTSSGDLWVADSSLNRLQEFNSKGEYVTQFGSSGTGDGQFKFPFGVAINKTTGDIYVADRENYRIQEFSSSGTFIRTFGYGVSDGAEKYEICTSSCRAGLMGSKVSEFWEPDGIAIDSSGNLWVVDEVNDRLEKISETGEYLNEYGSKGTGNGQLSAPVAIAYDKGNLYVTEAINDRVQEFSTEGAYVSKFGSEGAGNGQFEVPYAIAAGPSTSELYVTDRENNRVEIFTASGRFLSSFGSKGKGNGDMELPTGVVATTGETLYVSDHNNERIENWTGLTARITKYAYDADGNLESMTNPNGYKTKYSHDADNELTKVEEPNSTVTETGYNGAGQITSQTDGNKHTTKYVRNVLGEVTEIIDPLSRKTTKEYDAAGNLTSLTDVAKRTTTYKYDPANRITEITYSDGKTPTVKYEYDKDGNRTKMTDGTGTTKYVYDQLDRLTEAENGHKEVIKYEYSLASETTKITYPNGKNVTDAYDKDGRLEKVTDWLEHTTKFSYDPDSDLTATVYPSGTSEEDIYTYNLSDQMTETKMFKGTETIASLTYARDSDGQVDNTVNKGLLGSEVTEASYDTNSRLTKSGATTYKYDAANNPTQIGAGTYKYDSADELESGAGATYTYNEMGERTKTTPGTGPATTYGYDQAGNLISVERPKEGATSEIKDTYTYNGEGLRASQTVSGTTSYIAWDTTENTPLILSDGTNSYIYGVDGLPIEQINSATEKAQYLHHDQAGSTQFIAGETGTTEAAYSYTPYGAVEEHIGTATTPFGYDGQYTNSDTGLIYLRARNYDPATGQFLSVDPLVSATHEPYVYAGDDPLTYRDRSGLGIEEIFEPSPIPCPWCQAAQGVAEAIEGAYHEAQHGGEWVESHIGTEELGEPVEQGAGAAEKGCGLLEKDKTGRVHGDIPNYPNPEWTEEDLEQVAEDLRDSIGQRKQEQIDLGEESGHRNTINEQEKLLRQIEKKLSGS